MSKKGDKAGGGDKEIRKKVEEVEKKIDKTDKRIDEANKSGKSSEENLRDLLDDE